MKKINSNKKFTLNMSKGFTLIELLVVVAIIGTLSAIVLASLGAARSKGADAAIKADLVNLRAQAYLYYDNSGNYGTGDWIGGCPHTSNTVASTASIFLDSNVKSAMTHAGSLSGGTLAGSGGGALMTNTYCVSQVASGKDGWVVIAQLKSSTTAAPLSWCVDSSGASKQESFVIASSFNAASGSTPPTCK